MVGKKIMKWKWDREFTETSLKIQEPGSDPEFRREQKCRAVKEQLEKKKTNKKTM